MRWKCTKCGATASSKCVDRRNVFMDDQTAALWSYVVKIKEHTVEETPRHMTGYKHIITFQYTTAQASAAQDAAQIHALKCLRRMTDEVIEHLMCDHRWALTHAKSCCFSCVHPLHPENLHYRTDAEAKRDA